jgi:hypothetical protein
MQSVDVYRVHRCLLAFLLSLDVLLDGSQNLSIERSIILFCYLSYLFQQILRKPDGERLDLIFHATILPLFWLHVKWLGPLFPSPKICIRFAIYYLRG